VNHQPRTQLEVVTIATTALNMLVYTLWWNTPLNIQERIDVHGPRSAPLERRTRGLEGIMSILRDSWGSFTEGMGAYVAMTLPYSSLVFGGVHCFAWRFAFPTEQEQVLWRVSAVVCTACPLLAPFFPIGAASHTIDLPRRQRIFCSCVSLLSICPYVVCRVILLVLTFTSL
jgi:hypothetical protein